MWTYSLRKGTDIGVPKIKFVRRAKPGICLMLKLSGTSWRSGEEGIDCNVQNRDNLDESDQYWNMEYSLGAVAFSLSLTK